MPCVTSHKLKVMTGEHHRASVKADTTCGRKCILMLMFLEDLQTLKVNKLELHSETHRIFP